MLVFLIRRVYQKIPIVNRAVRASVGVHHAIRKPETRPCPYAREAGGCSEHFARQVKVVGSVAALSGALAAMSVCGPGDVFSPDCKPQPHAGTESFCDKIIGVGIDESLHCRPRSGVSGDWCAPKPGDIC